MQQFETSRSVRFGHERTAATSEGQRTMVGSGWRRCNRVRWQWIPGGKLPEGADEVDSGTRNAQRKLPAAVWTVGGTVLSVQVPVG